MNKNVRVAVYGFTANQSVLLSPFIRKLWNVSKITRMSKAGYDTICRHNVPVVIAGLSEENDISLCREKIEKTGTVKIGEPSNDTVESTYQEDFEKLSPKERSVMVCMLKGMKQACEWRKNYELFSCKKIEPNR